MFGDLLTSLIAGQQNTPESQGFAARSKDSPSRRLPGGALDGIKEPKNAS